MTVLRIYLSKFCHFAAIFDELIQQSGYKNRSRFLRDAAIYFAEIQQKGDLMTIDDGEVVEGASSVSLG